MTEYGYFTPAPTLAPPTVPPPMMPPPMLRPPMMSPMMSPPSTPPQAQPYSAMGQQLRPGHYPVGDKLSWSERFSAGLDLAKTCWGVLRDEPALLVVPLLTLLASAVVIVPLVLLAGGPADPQLDPVLAAIQALVAGIVVAVTSTVGTAVVVSAATTRLEGLRPSISASWSAVMACLPRLAGLGLLMVGERAVTTALRETPFGGLFANLIDRAWDFASFLAIPVILFEGTGPVRAVGRSGELVVSRWGSQLTARGVIHLAVFVCAVPLLVVLVMLGWLLSPVVALVMFGLWLLTVTAVSTALNGILCAAMYRFATTGLVVPGFREADMWRVFARA